MTCPFVVGQRVVCVSEGFSGKWDLSLGEKGPKANGIYTIRNMYVDSAGTVGLQFREIVNPPLQYSDGVHECGFLWKRFRPLRERPTETDISALRTLLTDTRLREDA